MSRRVDTMPDLPKRRPARFPWNEWLNGDVWELQYGWDVPADVLTLGEFRLLAAKTAQRRRQQLDMRVDWDTGLIYMQAVTA